MARPEPRGEPCANGGPAARWWLAERARAALTTREQPSGGGLSRSRAPGVGKLTDKVSISGQLMREPALSGECRLNRRVVGGTIHDLSYDPRRPLGRGAAGSAARR